MIDYPALLEDLAKAAREAGEAILEIVGRGFEIETKGDFSPVTVADRAAEQIILASLARAAPGVPVIAEEEVAAGRIPAHGDTYFLVDPLDGTKEFCRGGKDYTVNIGLIEHGAPKMGTVFAPATGRLHAGLVGIGAWVEDGRGARKSARGRRAIGLRRSPRNRTSIKRQSTILKQRWRLRICRTWFVA